MECRVWASAVSSAFYRAHAAVRQAHRPFDWARRTSEVRTGVGFFRGSIPNFQGKSPGIFPPLTPRSGTFRLTKSLKFLPNKVFRFIQPALSMRSLILSFNTSANKVFRFIQPTLVKKERSRSPYLVLWERNSVSVKVSRKALGIAWVFISIVI